MLEETLQVAHAMWAGERGTEGRHEGAHYTATRLLNSPQSLARPRVPIMIGGGGEKKTLRLVAQYADATNVFGGPEMLRRKYDILAGALRGGRPTRSRRSSARRCRARACPTTAGTERRRPRPPRTGSRPSPAPARST